MRYPRNIKILKKGFDSSAVLSVFFILVTFLLLNSSFVLKKGISADLELPQADLPGITGATMVIGIDRDGKYHYDGQIWNGYKLVEKISAAVRKMPDTTLVIVPDKDVSIEKLSLLTTLAYKAEIKKILIATDNNALKAS